MEEYPEELRTPPVSLVSLVGCPELHSLITSRLHSLHPPINTLALPDFSKVSLVAKKSKDSASHNPNPPGGILKRDWLLKHRTKVPAVIAALFSSDHISGDPAQWGQVCTHLDNLKVIIRPRNINLILIVVQTTSNDHIIEDRVIALRKRAEVDSKYLVVITPNDDAELERSLQRLGSTLAELANVFYRDEGRRVKMRVDKKIIGPTELHIRLCFKVAVYAEFRRDWIEALKFYEEAYHALREMIGTSTRLPAIQRLVEIKTIAELLHFKIATLLLHGGKVLDAIRWFHQHIVSYKKMLGAPEAVFVHWEWMSRQFLVFAELLETSSANAQFVSSSVEGIADRPLTEWELQPAYYYQLASHYLKEKRSSIEIALSMSEMGDNEIDGSGESVVPSTYVGQFARLVEQEVDAFSMQLISDEDYTCHALAEGKRFQDSFEIIALLRKSFELCGSLKAQRMGSLCGQQIAKEYFAVGDFSNAKQFFDGVASQYRKEGWVTMLWEVLGYLRECSKERGSVKDFIEYSLEMAALPVSSATDTQSLRFKECGPAGSPSLLQRELIHREVLGSVKRESGFSPDETNSFKVTEDNPIHLEIDLVSPLRVVLLASVAFHEQIIKPGASTSFTLSLLSQLPLTVEINQLGIQFNQSECNFTITTAQNTQLAAISNEQSNRNESAPSLALVTNTWLRLTYDIKSGQTGKLECVSVIAKIGSCFTICCRAESPASMDDLPLWKFEDRVETFPTKDSALAFSGQKATQVEEADPQVDVNLGASGPALVGESFIVPVTVASKGHDVFSGELKINLVDVKGGSLYSPPRETETYATGNNYVELIGVVGPEGEDEPKLGSEKIMNIQKSFGLVSVPFLKNGESWSCKLEIEWYRPKPIMLYVSLGYSPHSNEANAQKINVHKSLQIEGETAVVISHNIMLPFRQDSLLLSRIKPVANSEQSISLPLDETSILMVSSRNCTGVPLQLLAMTIEANDDENADGDGSIGSSCSIQQQGEDLRDPALLVPGEEFKKVFTIKPVESSSKLRLGTVHLKWSRTEVHSKSTPTWVLTKHRLPDVNVEPPPLVVNMECPPYAILGDPFTYLIKIRNQTQLLQEMKFSLSDSQNFVLSGSHNDMIFVLPKTEYVVSFKLVPFSSGSTQLPGISLTSVRYSAVFQPAISACSIFVFPAKPNLKLTDVEDKRTEPIGA